MKHLEFIQGTISRMSNTSFLLKGWSVTIIGGLFALSEKQSQMELLWMIVLIAIIMWGLDGYFLYQERLFRSLYNHVRFIDEEKIDFSMDTSKYKGGYNTLFQSVFSGSLSVFYFPLIVFVVYFIIKL